MDESFAGITDGHDRRRLVGSESTPQLLARAFREFSFPLCVSTTRTPARPVMLKSLLQLAVAIIIPQLAGVVGAVATSSAVDTWYQQIERPGFTPPDWLFGPVWMTLYALMGIASWLVFRQGWDQQLVRIALGTYAVQLLLNTAWSPAFFGLQSPGLGLVVIAPMWLAIIATMVLFWRVSRPAAVLLVPYILWVSYAVALNFEIWRLN